MTLDIFMFTDTKYFCHPLSMDKNGVALHNKFILLNIFVEMHVSMNIPWNMGFLVLPCLFVFKELSGFSTITEKVYHVSF